MFEMYVKKKVIIPYSNDLPSPAEKNSFDANIGVLSWNHYTCCASNYLLIDSIPQNLPTFSMV